MLLAGLESGVRDKKESEIACRHLAWMMRNLVMVLGEKAQEVSATFPICWIVVP